MTSISITPISTSNTAPTLTGYVDFQRFDSLGGKPKETISVYVNYRKYTLFDGNLGLDETVKPNKWKLHFSQNLAPGTYQVEAYVSDTASNTILASDTKEAGITITQPTPVEIKQQNPTILEKVATVALLMASLDKLFGGKNGIAPVPSVHPAINDEASTALVGRGNEERAEDTMVKSKKQTERKGNVKANPVANKAVDPTASAAGTYSLTDIERAAAGDLNVVDNLDFLSAGSRPSDTIADMQETAEKIATQDAAISSGAGTIASTGARISGRNLGVAIGGGPEASR
jgi:PBP1b-binding outer membrane lipoprotein LpoB